MNTFVLFAVLANLALSAYVVYSSCRFTAITDDRHSVWIACGVEMFAFGFAVAAQLLGDNKYIEVRDAWAMFFCSAAVAWFLCFKIVMKAANSGRRTLPLERRDKKNQQISPVKERRHHVVGT